MDLSFNQYVLNHLFQEILMHTNLFLKSIEPQVLNIENGNQDLNKEKEMQAIINEKESYKNYLSFANEKLKFYLKKR